MRAYTRLALVCFFYLPTLLASESPDSTSENEHTEENKNKVYWKGIEEKVQSKKSWLPFNKSRYTLNSDGRVTFRNPHHKSYEYTKLKNHKHYIPLCELLLEKNGFVYSTPISSRRITISSQFKNSKRKLTIVSKNDRKFNFSTLRNDYVLTKITCPLTNKRYVSTRYKLPPTIGDDIVFINKPRIKYHGEVYAVAANSNTDQVCHRYGYAKACDDFEYHSLKERLLKKRFRLGQGDDEHIRKYFSRICCQNTPYEPE